MIIVALVFIVCLIIGLPIAFLLGLTGITHLVTLGDLSYFSVIINRMISGINNIGLSALPFFIIAGELMNEGGNTKRLFAFVRELVRNLKGGLAYCGVIVAAILAAILGSANAVSSLLCKVLIPEMKKDGYPEDFSAALIASSGVLGPIIPPSVTFVFYSVLTNVSVKGLFIGGIVPGILLMAGFAGVIFVQGKRGIYPPAEGGFNWHNVFKAFIKAVPALLVPVCLIGGIVTGVFTPTESGAVACVLSVIVGLFYRDLNIKHLPGALVRAVLVSAALIVIVSFGNIIGWTLAMAGVKEAIYEWIFSITTNKYIITGILLLFMLVIGMVLDATAAMLIFVPVMVPIANAIGLPGVHFGIIYCLMNTIGLITPPVGMVLFVTSNVSGVDYTAICKKAIPFCVVALAITVFFAYFPNIVMWLPNLLG